MKTVGEFKDAGLVFVKGDKCYKDGSSGDEFHRHWYEAPKMYRDQVISEFAWRENTGVKPEFMGLIEFTFDREGYEEMHEVRGTSNINWSIVKKWRPSLNQSLSISEHETKESAIHKAWVELQGDLSNAKKYDKNGSYLAVCIKDGFFIKEGLYCLTESLVDNTEHWKDVCTVKEFTSYCEKMAAEEKRMDIIGQNGNDGLHYDTTSQQVESLAVNAQRPIFTRVMADANELPPIGSFVDVVGKNGVELFYGEGEVNCEVLAHVENTAVIKMGYGLGCFSSDALKASDTRTDIEKAIDDALFDIGAKIGDVSSIGAVVSCMINAGYRKC